MGSCNSLGVPNGQVNCKPFGVPVGQPVHCTPLGMPNGQIQLVAAASNTNASIATATAGTVNAQPAQFVPMITTVPNEVMQNIYAYVETVTPLHTIWDADRPQTVSRTRTQARSWVPLGSMDTV